jgi:hypothetical protein
MQIEVELPLAALLRLVAGRSYGVKNAGAAINGKVEIHALTKMSVRLIRKEDGYRTRKRSILATSI